MTPKTHKQISRIFFGALAILANVTARMSAGTASSWGRYQPRLPKKFSR